MKPFLQEIMKKKYLEHQTLVWRVICPSEPVFYIVDCWIFGFLDNFLCAINFGTHWKIYVCIALEENVPTNYFLHTSNFQKYLTDKNSCWSEIFHNPFSVKIRVLNHFVEIICLSISLSVLICDLSNSGPNYISLTQCTS